MEKYDLIIVGAGPAGIFTAVELLRHGSKKKMLLVEKGKPVEKRHCPKAEVGHCVNCRPTCAITTGFSGAGAFSDGKLSLSYEVGGDLPTLIGEEFAQELIDYTDKIYLEFGADPHVEGIYTGEDIKEIRKNAIHAGLKLVDCPIRHLGTEKAQELYLAIQNYLADQITVPRFSTDLPEFAEAEKAVQAKIDKFMSIQGNESVDSIHKKLGHIMWEYVGMGRTAEGLKKGIAALKEIRKEFETNLFIPGSKEGMNVELDKAIRLYDFITMGELVAYDALNRNESCGGHFREEYQTEEGEAKRDDENFFYVACWEYQGDDEKAPILIKEPLVYEAIKVQTRNYKS